MDDFIIKRKVKIISVKDIDVKLFLELRIMDYKVDAPELLSLTIAIRKKASVFMTADKNMEKSEKLKHYVKR